MHDTDPPLHNQPSPKDLFQAGYSVSGSRGTVGQRVLKLQGSPGFCPVEPDCLTAPTLWRKWGWGGPLGPLQGTEPSQLKWSPDPPADLEWILDVTDKHTAGLQTNSSEHPRFVAPPSNQPPARLHSPASQTLFFCLTSTHCQSLHFSASKKKEKKKGINSNMS